ncbi:MAG: hypothetical protein IJL89_02725 [Firmicutes bacterium]|nr:hypothetical protein [Bacillota bacterium]
MVIKLPLGYGFAFLCDFIAALHDGLNVVAEGATDNETAVDRLRAAIIAGTVSVG